MATPVRQTLNRKLVIVGDPGCGKTSLLIRYGLGSYREGVFVPSTFEGYVADVELDGKDVELALWDTDGEEAYDRLRPLRYPKAHVILICFAVDSPESLIHVREKWLKEVSHFCPEMPILLVGCKTDLRTDPAVVQDLAKMDQRPVSHEEGMALAQKIGAKAYLECSVKRNEGIRIIFQTAAQESLLSKPKKRRRGPCIIL